MSYSEYKNRVADLKSPLTNASRIPKYISSEKNPKSIKLTELQIDDVSRRLEFPESPKFSRPAPQYGITFEDTYTVVLTWFEDPIRVLALTVDQGVPKFAFFDAEWKCLVVVDEHGRIYYKNTENRRLVVDESLRKKGGVRVVCGCGNLESGEILMGIEGNGGQNWKELGILVRRRYNSMYFEPYRAAIASEDRAVRIVGVSANKGDYLLECNFFRKVYKIVDDELKQVDII